MNTMQTSTKQLIGKSKNARIKAPVEDSTAALFPEPTNRGVIQWPTEKQLLDVSKKLTQISRMGIRAEANGDYFNSGDLAYQVQEIIRTTTGLFERGRRLQRKANGEE